MRSLLTLLTLFSPVVLGLVHVKRFEGKARNGHYIVKFKQPPAGGRVSVSASVAAVPEGAQTYENVFHGFAAPLDDDEVERLRKNNAVEGIWEDGIASAQDLVTQNDAPWGLERISHVPKIVQHSDPLSYNYTREDVEGFGVDVYIVDTGINVDHVEFEGRARLGAAFGYTSAVDDNGHGTHCAGTVGSKKYGVAKKVNLIAVKVLGADGNGAWSQIISGLEWVIDQAAATGRPSVVNLSIGGGHFQPADDAVESVAQAGIHIAVAAGNANSPIPQTSPGNAPTAITVGAVDIADTFAGFSNYGPQIDVNAPGVDVISTYIGSTTATATLSGTSMATPHVAGLVAYFISLNGNSSPADMSTFIKSKAIKGAITGLKGNTPNNLAFNGVESLKRRGLATRQNIHSLLERKSRRERFLKKKAVA